jgi:hypothetical protein
MPMSRGPNWQSSDAFWSNPKPSTISLVPPRDGPVLGETDTTSGCEEYAKDAVLLSIA